MGLRITVMYQYTDYTLAAGLRTVSRSKILSVKFNPYNMDGWSRLMSILRKEHPDAEDILITNIRPIPV